MIKLILYVYPSVKLIFYVKPFGKNSSELWSIILGLVEKLTLETKAFSLGMLSS